MTATDQPATSDDPNRPKGTDDAARDVNDEPDRSAKISDPQPSAGEETDAGLSDDDSRIFQQNASVINQFIGDTYAAESTFGPAAPATLSGRRATGLITAERIAILLRGHVPPDPFAEAVRKLNLHHLLVLTGDEGIGKRVGALAVLEAVRGTGLPVTSLPPSRTLAELAAATFHAGRGYLVHDWVGDRSSAPLRQFDVDQLRRALERAGAGTYLVLTCQLRPAERRQLEDVIVEWAAPGPIDVLDARIRATGVEIAPDQDAYLRERIVELRRPRDVVAVVDRACLGVDEAFAVLGAADHQKVVAWFDRKPAPRALLSVAALCFLHGASDMVFQSLLSRLVVLVNEHAALDTVARDTAASAAAEAFPQQVTGDLGLDEVVVTGTGDAGSHRMRQFASIHFRERVVEELVRQYGFELWEPMRAWIDEVAALSSSPLQVHVAFGVALLARHAPDQVELFLDEWSNGPAPQRLTAAYVLSWMCVDDTLAATALRIAQRWTSGSGTRRAATAAIAFAGELGIRYQSEALNKLWHLTLRVVAVSDSAAGALGILLSSAVDDDATTGTMLRFLRAALRRLIDDGVGVPAQGNYVRTVAKALSAIRRILCWSVLRTGEPVTATILRNLPDCVPTLSDLWAEVLRSARQRAVAVTELCRVMDVLGDDTAGRQVIATFGAAVRRHLSDEENRLLRQQLTDTWARRNQPGSGVQVLRLLLKALGAPAS